MLNIKIRKDGWTVIKFRKGCGAVTTTRSDGNLILNMGDRRGGHLGTLYHILVSPKGVSGDTITRLAKDFGKLELLAFEPSWQSKVRYYKKLVKRDAPCSGTRMYILINKRELTPVQWGVQAAHAVATFIDKYHDNTKRGEPKYSPTDAFQDHPEYPPTLAEKIRKWARKHKTMIFLACSQKERIQIFKKVKDKAYADFFEPDLRGTWTATAFEPMSREEGNARFGSLKRL